MDVTSLAAMQATLPQQESSKLKEQTDAFEAIIVKMLLDEAMNAQNPLFPEDPGGKIYRSMYNDALSQELTGGFGYSELLFEHLSQKGSGNVLDKMADIPYS